MVFRTLQNVRKIVSSFHHDCHEQVTKLAGKINVEVKIPPICSRQTHRRNALPDDQADQPPGQQVKNYFQINVRNYSNFAWMILSQVCNKDFQMDKTSL